MALGSKIRQRREALDMLQADFAAKVGVAQSTAADWESGSMNPRLDKLAKIARVLKCEVAELVA